MWFIIKIFGLMALTNLFIHSEPTNKLKYTLYKKIWPCQDYTIFWHWRLINCALCSGFWLGLLFTQNIYLAAIISIGAEFISKKLTEGRL